MHRGFFEGRIAADLLFQIGAPHEKGRGLSKHDGMSGILQPTGTLASSQMKADLMFHTDGSTRLTNTTGTMDMVAPAVITATATAVKLPASIFDTTVATFDALTINGASQIATVAVPVVTATNTLATNVLQSTVTATDTLRVSAKKVTLAADVLIGGRIDVVSATSMNVKDKTISMGAIDADGDNTADTSDLTRDGAGIVIPGPPANLPGSKTASNYEHSVKWYVHSGDFNGGGTPVVAHLKPMWHFAGGGIAIASPDFTNREARFLFAPSFTSTSASLGMYYAVGANAYLVQSFSTTPLP